jgi:hypothetical protein
MSFPPRRVEVGQVNAEAGGKRRAPLLMQEVHVLVALELDDLGGVIELLAQREAERH